MNEGPDGFMLPPVRVLQTMEETRQMIDQAMPDPDRRSGVILAGVNASDKGRVRSNWIIGLIDEIAGRPGRQSDIVYNYEVKQLAAERQGIVPESDDWYHQEGDALSLLCYNAQCYRRDDEARARDAQETADGWVKPTQDWLRERLGRKVEVLRSHEKKPARIAVFQGDLCIMPHGAKVKRYVIDPKFKCREVRS